MWERRGGNMVVSGAVHVGEEKRGVNHTSVDKVHHVSNVQSNSLPSFYSWYLDQVHEKIL